MTDDMATEQTPAAQARCAASGVGEMSGSTKSVSAYGYEVRCVAAKVDAAGKYEPKLTENGIPADVLAKLLP